MIVVNCVYLALETLHASSYVISLLVSDVYPLGRYPDIARSNSGSGFTACYQVPCIGQSPYNM